LYFAFRERGKPEARKRGDPIMAAADDVRRPATACATCEPSN
jgi:hypothetical protein